MALNEREQYEEDRRLQDLAELDDDPVLGEPQICVDCGESGSKQPVFAHPGDAELRCDACWTKSEEFGRRRLNDCDYQDEIFFEFNVKIGVKIRDRSDLELKTAKLRAMEVLLGMPMTNDQESWEHELIFVGDENDSEINIPNGDH